MPQTATSSPSHTLTKQLTGSVPFLWSTELAPRPDLDFPPRVLVPPAPGWSLVPGRYMLISRGWEVPLCLIAAGDWAVGDGGDGTGPPRVPAPGRGGPPRPPRGRGGGGGRGGVGPGGGARQLCAWGADPRPWRLWVTGKSRRRRVRQGLAGAGSQGVAGREGVLERCSQLQGRLQPSGPARAGAAISG